MWANAANAEPPVPLGSGGLHKKDPAGSPKKGQEALGDENSSEREIQIANTEFVKFKK